MDFDYSALRQFGKQTIQGIASVANGMDRATGWGSCPLLSANLLLQSARIGHKPSRETTTRMNIATNTLGLPVLVLNSNWQAISSNKTVRRALEDMTSGKAEDNWLAPFRGMDVELAPDGELEYANPVDWDDWMELPVRPGDEYIYTGRRYIRAPRVIISRNYSKTRVRAVSLSKEAVKKRDRGQCQYCHEFFPMSELNIDHVVPQYHGGADTWENMVCSCIPCNSKKGHKMNHEIGYKLLRQPKAPLPRAETAMVVEIKHPSWAPFLPHAK